MRPIAHIKTEFPDKFGIPRQAGLVPQLRGTVIFEPEFRDPQALRGIEGFSHLWLIWEFSRAGGEDWSPTVRPPRLGGNERLGVFATRSPFRPNRLGLSCVGLAGVEHTREFGTVLHVTGADLMDGTPIFDVKPYVPYADCHPEATQGFTAPGQDYLLEVELPPAMLERVPPAQREALRGVLGQDPRPAYQRDPRRVYGLRFAGREVRFRVEGSVLTVLDILEE